MGQPKKRTTPRRTGNRRSHHLRKLAARVNATSPVKVILGPKRDVPKAEQSEPEKAPSKP